MRMLLFSLYIFLSIAACNDVCDVGDTKCENNRVYTCEGSEAEKQTNWSEFLNCSDYDTTCQGGIYTQFNDLASFSRNVNHSCVLDSYDCEDTNGYYCTDDNEYVVNCMVPIDGEESVAVISAINWDERPFCVYGLAGVGFAWDEDPCEVGDRKCDEEGRDLMCFYYTWQWFNSYDCNF